MELSKKRLQKIETKQRILNVASRLFKKNGYSATGVDEIMKEAGLTAGGFYAHFKSKEDLLEQSIQWSIQATKQQLTKDTEYLYGKDKIAAILNRYLSTQHRDMPEKGCVIPTLAAELHRSKQNNKESIDNYLKTMANTLSAHITDSISDEDKKKKALALLSQAVGAVLLSRMVNEELSDEILNSVRQDLEK